MIGLLDRDGHLAELTLHRVVAGELEGDATLAGHLATCAPCRERLAGLRAAAAAPLPPLRLERAPEPTSPVRDEPRGEVVPLRRRWIPAAAVAMLAAAAALFVLRAPPTPAPDTFTSRGAALRLEVYRDAHGGAERLASGASVRAGDRIGFRVATHSDGWLLVAGVDGAGAAYQVWPGGDAPSAPFAAVPEGVKLEAALALDATPGAERLVALRCPEALAWRDVADRLSARASAGEAPLPPLFPTCDQDEVRLVKAAAR